MKKLLEFLVKNIVGDDGFSVNEQVNDDFVNYSIKTKPENMGLLIGKGGMTIKTIRNLLRVRATLEKKGVSVTIEE